MSFFDRLPYDIRAGIYGYLEPNRFPPFSSRFEAHGFVLSCRQAKNELDEMARQRLGAFLVQIRKSAVFPLDLKSDDKDLRHITVELPSSSFHGTGWHGPGIRILWKREVLETLHQLFTQYFDAVHIHISHRGVPQVLPTQDTLFALGCIEMAMQGLLRDIEYMIKHVNSCRDDAHTDLPMSAIFHERGSRQIQYPGEHVKTRRISLSWDLRSEDTGRGMPVELNGRLHQARSTTLSKPSSSLEASPQDARAATNSDPMELPTTKGLTFRERPMYYHMHGHQRLVGETGLQCRDRWSNPQSWSSNELLNGLEDSAEYVSSDSLGGGLHLGLRGMNEAQYCNEEAEICHALWAQELPMNPSTMLPDCGTATTT